MHVNPSTMGKTSRRTCARSSSTRPCTASSTTSSAWTTATWPRRGWSRESRPTCRWRSPAATRPPPRSGRPTSLPTVSRSSAGRTTRIGWFAHLSDTGTGVFSRLDAMMAGYLQGGNKAAWAAANPDRRVPGLVAVHVRPGPPPRKALGHHRPRRTGLPADVAEAGAGERRRHQREGAGSGHSTVHRGLQGRGRAVRRRRRCPRPARAEQRRRHPRDPHSPARTTAPSRAAVPAPRTRRVPAPSSPRWPAARAISRSPAGLAAASVSATGVSLEKFCKEKRKSCLVGDWTSTGFQLSLAGGGITASGGAGVTLKVGQDGATAVRFDGMAPVNFTSSAGTAGFFTYQGTVTGKIALAPKETGTGPWAPSRRRVRWRHRVGDHHRAVHHAGAEERVAGRAGRCRRERAGERFSGAGRWPLHVHLHVPGRLAARGHRCGWDLDARQEVIRGGRIGHR